MLRDLLPPETSEGTRDFYKYVALAAFLAGGAVGGVFFGAVADRIGRARTMIVTILMYSLFTFLTAFAQSWWQVVVLRFLVALGVGGEWAVASAMVSEVFPPRARGWSGSIFHGSSTFGTYLAVAAGTFVVPVWGWQRAFLLGAAPALLTLWIRWNLREPEQWTAARSQAAVPQRASEQLLSLFGPGIASRTALGFSLAVVGLATYWGVHINGKEMSLRRARTVVEQRAGLSEAAEARERELVWRQNEANLKSAEMLGMLITATGGGIGLFAFGPISERLGRRGAFMLFHLGGLGMALLMFLTYPRWGNVVFFALLALFGFWTLGMHAGYAIYFPELYPTRMRSLGSGFCFNFARITTTVMLVVNGYLRHIGMPLETAGTLLSLLFLVGAAIAWLGPETKGTTLAS